MRDRSTSKMLDTLDGGPASRDDPEVHPGAATAGAPFQARRAVHIGRLWCALLVSCATADPDPPGSDAMGGATSTTSSDAASSPCLPGLAEPC